MMQVNGRGEVHPISEFLATSSEKGVWGRPSWEGSGFPRAAAEPAQQQQFASGAQQATTNAAGGVVILATTAQRDPTPPGRLCAGEVEGVGYQYGEMAKLLEWGRHQPPVRYSTSGSQQSPPASHGTTRWVSGGAAPLHLNDPCRSSAIARAPPEEWTSQERAPPRVLLDARHHQPPIWRGGKLLSNRASQESQPRASSSNVLEIHQLEHLPRLQSSSFGNPILGPRSPVTPSMPSSVQMPLPAAGSPAHILERAYSGHVSHRTAPTHAETTSKRARFEPPQVEPPTKNPAEAASRPPGEGPTAGQAPNPEGPGIPGRAEQLQKNGLGRGFPFTGGRPPLPPTRMGLKKYAAAQVRQAIPGFLLIWLMFITLA
jgi:hypothetical protein